MNFATPLKPNRSCIWIASFSYHLVTLFHTLCVYALLHPARVYDTWTTQIAPPSPFHFYAFSPSFPSHVEQGRAVAVAGIRHVSPPLASLAVLLLHVHTHNPAELCMTSQTHSVRFLCLCKLLLA